MNKDESQIMKGVAILFMLFLHLFNQMGNVTSTHYGLSFGGEPLVYLLTRATNPVAFFLVLSGYGLYISHSRGRYKVWSKLKSLYIHYWITLALFVPLGWLVVGAHRYPGSWEQLLGNLTGWSYSYNGEVWFLFPYILVMLTSGWIIRILNRSRPWASLAAVCFLSLCTGFVISRYGALYLYDNPWLYKPVLYIQFLCPFTFGVYLAKYQIVKRFAAIGGGNFLFGYQKVSGNPRCWMLLLLLVVFRCCFRTGAFHTLYVVAFILLFVNAPRPKPLDAFLMEMGRRSTSMWFVHSYFCYYLFHDFIYGFRYPVLIFGVLLLLSYLSARVIDAIHSFYTLRK